MTSRYSLKRIIPSINWHSRATQSSVLFGSMILAMGLSFAGSIITARLLGSMGYGDVKFVQALWALLALVLTFGYLHAGSRVLLLEHDRGRQREVTGAILAIALAIGCAIAALTALLARPIDQLFDTHVAEILVWLAPLTVALPLRDALMLVLQSLNRIWLLVLLNVLPSLLYLAGLLALPYFGNLTPGAVLSLQQVTLLAVMILLILPLQPRIAAFRDWLGAFKAQNRSYGRPVYVGSLAGVASAHVNRLAISYWVDNAAVGVYSLALSLVEPLKMIPNSVATASFRDFSHQQHIRRKVLVATIVASILALAAAFWLFGKPLSMIYSEDFAAVGPMARVAAVGAVLYGFGDFYNRFLGAHGRGQTLRNTAFLVGIVNVAGFFILVPWLGAWGGILTTLVAGVAYILFMVISYRRYTALTTAGASEDPSSE